MSNKPKEIYNWIKQMKRLSTNKVAVLSGIPHPYAIKYLEELEKEGLIIKEKETNAVYWRLA